MLATRIGKAGENGGAAVLPCYFILTSFFFFLCGISHWVLTKDVYLCPGIRGFQ
jgi:hypothetical protein